MAFIIVGINILVDVIYITVDPSVRDLLLKNEKNI